MSRLVATISAMIVALTITATAAASGSAGVLPSIFTGSTPVLKIGKGGRVQRHPIVRLVLWGPAWQHDTTGIAAAEESLFEQLPGSSYSAILRQYGVEDVRFGGVYVDPSAPRRVTIWRLAREAAKVARLRRWKNTPETQWIILPQSGAHMPYGDECGEHDEQGYGGSTYRLALIVPMTERRFSDCVYDYSGDDGNQAPSLVGATTSVTTHEFAEMATDPMPWDHTGWMWPKANEGEIGDLCAWYSGVPAGMTVNVSYLWSNAEKGCVLGATS